MPETQIKEATASFQTQGRLLQELGERLVAKADVALLELVKNSYDADASLCRVKFDGENIEIIDDGHGMTENEFLDNWMRIATSDKQRQRFSRRFRRRVTGSKGIGRFAVRFLGRRLRLETVAVDISTGGKTLLRVEFDWENIDAAEQLHTVDIKYQVWSTPSDQNVGTRLIIEELRDPETIYFSKERRTELLSIINPYARLNSDRFARRGESTQDPGFTVLLPEIEDQGEEDPIANVLNKSFARLTIDHSNGKCEYIIRHKDGRILLQRRLEYQSHISKGFFADIRYFPRRAGMFQDTGVDGRVIYSWLRDNGGVGIVDHGFRIRPYGFKDDDWLNLGLDSGHNRRGWRVEFMNDLYPMPPEAASHAKLSPMLYLPNFHQLVGAVFVESSQNSGSELPTDLTPSMDREGFVDNTAFRDLFELVRAGLEMLAFADHSEQRHIEAETALRQVEGMREDYRAAVQYVSTIPSLSERDRQQVIERFQILATELEDVQDYQKTAVSRMETIALLGVLAGFLTHEMKRLIHDLDRVVEELENNLDSLSLSETLVKVRKLREEIAGQVQFASTYISNVQAPHVSIMPLNVKSQVNRVLERFRFFTDERKVRIECTMDEDLMTPPLPVTLYSGVLLNLYTNALKAVFGGQGASTQPRVEIKAWNLPKYHILEVADTGIGIPPSLRTRIWDPLFTTTSGGSSNPLGSGMGLGLSLVKRLLTEVGAKIELVDPPPGFKTCFRVQYPK